MKVRVDEEKVECEECDESESRDVFIGEESSIERERERDFGRTEKWRERK